MVKVIAYDKDGTLLNYEKIWTPFAKASLDAFEAHFDLGYDEAFRREVGFVDEKIQPNSMLASGTGRDIQNAYDRRAYGGGDWAEEYYLKHVQKYLNNMELLPGAVEALREGQRLGYKNAIVTSDSRLSTEAFLKKFNLNELVDFVIAGDDSIYSKPDVEVLDTIIEAGYTYDEIAVVGDNYTDTQLGKDDGVTTIGVLSGTSTREFLSDAHHIVDGVHELFNGGKFIV